MNILKAKEIITALADGVDPYTGEVLPNDSPYQNPKTVRALFLALNGLKMINSKEEKIKSLPDNAGNPWTNQEDIELSKSFDEGLTISELSIKHGRTRGAIQSRLVKLGKIQK